MYFDVAKKIDMGLRERLIWLVTRSLKILRITVIRHITVRTRAVELHSILDCYLFNEKNMAL